MGKKSISSELAINVSKTNSLMTDRRPGLVTVRLCGVYNRVKNVCMEHLGPVQTSCFCRAELNSGIKFDKSTAEARRLNQTFELSSASN